MVQIVRDEIKKHQGSLTDLVKIYDLISSDCDPLRNVEAVYLFGQTRDNEQSVFQSAREIRDRGLKVPVFVLDGPDPNDARFKRSGFPGYEQWAKKLKSNFGLETVPLEPLDKNNLNTYTEAQALVRTSKEGGPKSWYIVVAPFHMLRAFISAASVAIKKEPSLKIFAYSGAEQDWDEKVVHSQGVLIDTRRNLIKHELKKIKIYSTLGYLLKRPKKILEYLSRREGIYLGI